MNQEIVVGSSQVVMSLEDQLEKCQNQIKQMQSLLQYRVREEINEIYENEMAEFERISEMLYQCN